MKLFSWEKFFGNDGSQNTFVYQPTLYMLDVKDNGTDHHLIWKSKEICTSKLNYTTSILLSCIAWNVLDIMWKIEFDRDFLAGEQKKMGD